MQFGFVSAFFWTLLAIPIVTFYLLKVRFRRQTVATTMFWEQVIQEKQAKSIWQQLRHWLSLVLQLAFLLLVILALAEPRFAWDTLKPRRVILVIDHSASMNATDAGPNRLDRAKAKAATLINRLRWCDEMAIIAASSVARVQVGLTSHQRTLHEALESIKPTNGTGSLTSALGLSERLLADHKHGRVLLLSDGCEPSVKELLEPEYVQLIGTGDDTPNAGITKFQVRRSLIDPIGYEILVSVMNASENTLETTLDVDLGKLPVDSIPLRLQPGEVWTQVLRHASAEGGELKAVLRHEDALMSDNIANAILPKRERIPVVLVTQGSLFLQKIFEAIPYVDLTMTDDASVTAPKNGVIVYHRKLPNQLPEGNSLVIDPQGATDLFTLGPLLETPIVTKQESSSELMRHVRLENVLLPDARLIDFKTQPVVLVESVEGAPLFATLTLPSINRRVGVLTVNLSKGDLPLRTAFPILITNTMSWFLGNKGELREAVAAGQTVRLSVDRLRQRAKRINAKTRFKLKSPIGSEFEIPMNSDEVVFGPLEQQGIWDVLAYSEESTERQSISHGSEAHSAVTVVDQIACNLTNNIESDLRPAHQSETYTSPLMAGLGGRPGWFYVVLIAFALTTAEWFFYQRRWIS